MAHDVDSFRVLNDGRVQATPITLVVELSGKRIQFLQQLNPQVSYDNLRRSQCNVLVAERHHTAQKAKRQQSSSRYKEFVELTVWYHPIEDNCD